MERATGVKPKIIPGGKSICEHIGVVTGGAGGELKVAAAEGVDTFITGEGPHWTYALAERTGVECFLRRPLRNRNVRREGAGGGIIQEIQTAVGIH
ncbi:MAG: Nif3-like dinuclear metal center hexameric protein [Limisphaerales bacterium]